MQRKLRAVVYCRVSTNSDEQVGSLDKQVAEAVEAVDKLGFDLVDRFIDEGRTGTTSMRKEYSRMLTQIEEHSFDVIVTKSLDRMNRNILDFYLLLDLIIRNHIKLYFYLDRTYYKPDDKIVIGIKAILAEEYSRELSKKLSNAHAKRQERGEVMMLSSLTYGYKKEILPDGKKKIVVVEEEAEMIRLIFDYCKEGYGARAIGKMLYSHGYRNRQGNEIGESTIRRIIRNPLVMGTMIMNKVKFDFNTKTTIHTNQDQWLMKENAVPAIISKEDWDAANALMDSRVQTKKINKNPSRQGRNRGKYNFSGKLICGMCGKPYYKSSRNNKSSQVIQWKCSTYLKFGRKNAEYFKTNSAPKDVDIGKGCDSPSIDETLLIGVLGTVAEEQFEQMIDKQTLIEETMSILEKILEEAGGEGDELDLQKKIQIISQRQETLLEKYLDRKVSDDNYEQMENKLKEEKSKLELQLKEMEDDRNMVYKVKQRLGKIEESLRVGGIEQATAFTLMDSIKSIVVYKDYIRIIFDQLQILGIEGYSKMLDGNNEYTLEISLNSYQVKNTNMAIEQSKEIICRMIAEDPEISLKRIAEKLGLSERTVFERVAALKKDGKVKVKGRGAGRRWFVGPS
ncbi:recombinase family protein [Clostridium sp. WB02_MRS01]|uniref:recombinase family protein n=1 Tax=Clostridium sp. WB02_MRS01 TaxID=2605777 RepID=UPI0018A6CB60|nr:recombinase family protein [Clostridium sp. WB02_MRS01]